MGVRSHETTDTIVKLEIGAIHLPPATFARPAFQDRGAGLLILRAI